MTEKKVAILQSNYIPWKGYFDIIGSVDEFIIYDDVQYTQGDWRNRNLIKTLKGLQWLTVPIEFKFSEKPLIQDIEIKDKKWQKKHWSTISQSYSKAAFYKQYKEIFEELYKGRSYTHLSDLNTEFIKVICNLLGITTRLTSSKDYTNEGKKTERLINICKEAKATEYVSGPAGANYIVSELFAEAGIKLSYVEYDNYPEYPQLFSPFVHEVSILDLLFNTGPESLQYMKFCKK